MNNEPHSSVVAAADVCSWITTVFNYMYYDLQDIKGVCNDNRPQG